MYTEHDQCASVHWDMLKKISVAKCAWTSYRTPEGEEPTDERCIKIYDQLCANRPIHASPFEHQAMAIHKDERFALESSGPFGAPTWELLPEGLELHINKGKHSLWSGNLRGWVQHRKLIEGENIV
jgi:hypothetical protein